MAYSRIKIWIAAEILTAADQNAEFSGCIANENDLDIRLNAEVASRVALESEHDTLQGNVWNAGTSEIATNRVSQDSMKDNSIGNPELKALAVTHEKVAAANKDGAIDVPSMRTLGIEALQACPGTDSRFLARMQEFTENGTFTAESTKILLEMWSGGGGGGGGARNAGNYGGGGGGGSGRYAKKIVTVVVGTEYSVVVGVKGDGGNGGTSGHPAGYDAGDGGTSSLGTHTCFGGLGGSGGPEDGHGAGGAGGTGGTMPTYPGEAGVAGQSGLAGGMGGTGRNGSFFSGYGGAGGNQGVPGSNAGGYCGSGGGGGSTNNPTNGKAGGDGVPGLVRITW